MTPREQELQAQLDLERQQRHAQWLEQNETIDVLRKKVRKLNEKLMVIENPTIKLRRFPW